MRTINRIIVHCTATPQWRDVTVADIDRWHRQRGFQGIGYHYVIYLDGSVHEGRPIEQIGAHCYGYNTHSIGVCYVGGLSADGTTPMDTRTDAQKSALIKLITDLRSQFPNATVHGHREFANKACPCFDVAELIPLTNPDKS
jgi:N-acetylmuramoyl-L-alanine amidase